MRNLIPAFVLGLMLISVIDLYAGVGTVVKDEEKSDTSMKHIQKGSRPATPSMRVEEPDGTLRPLMPGTMPESRMSTEGLKEVPDAGGGTMVNVEGRFKSILQLPEGSDEAVHGHAAGDSQQFKH